MAGPAARTTIDPSDGRRGRIRRQARLARSDAPAVMDRLAPSQHATWQAARQRLRSDAEIAFGGEVSCGPCLLCSRSRNQSAAIEKTCRSKRASSFLICTRTLSNAALAARAARSASRAAASPKVHCHATSGSLPSPLGCLTNISPAGRPIERRTAEALRRRSSTSAAKPGLAKYCVRSTIIVALVGTIVPCPSAAAGTIGRAAVAVRCRNCRRRNSIVVAPSPPRHSITSSARNRNDSGIRHAERLSDGQVDDEIELGGLLDRDVTRLRPAQNLVNIISGAPELVRKAWPIGHETSRFNVFTSAVHGRQSSA